MAGQPHGAFTVQRLGLTTMPDSDRSRVRSLADELRTWSVDSVAALLELRPDLVEPIPVDLRDLALRAGTAHSVGLALDQLTASELIALEVLAALGRPASDADLAACLGVDDRTASDLMGSLRRRALVWGNSAAHIVRAAADAFGAHPCALLVPMSHARANVRAFERDSSLVAQAVDRLTPGARALAGRLAQAGPILLDDDTGRAVDARSATGAATELLDAGLLIIVDETTLAMPREVALPLRNWRWHPQQIALSTTATASRPDDSSNDSNDSTIDAAVDFVAHTRTLLTTLLQQPIKLGKHLTPHRPDVTRVAEHLGWTYEHTVNVLVMAVAAELVGLVSHPQDCLATSHRGDTWLNLNVAEQWLELVRAWQVDADVVICTIVEGSFDVRRLQSTSLERAKSAARAWVDYAVAGHTLDAEGISWFRPRLWSRASLELGLAAGISEILGLSSGDRLSPLGRIAYTRSDTEVLREFQERLGPSIDFFYVQPDHTVIAPGRLNQPVRSMLLEIADVESEDRALVARVTPASLRRGLNNGKSSEVIASFLRQHSRTGIPQSIDYLITDLARNQRQVHIDESQTVLRFSAVSELHAARSLLEAQGLPCEILGDTVMSTTSAPPVIGRYLREAGFTVTGSVAPTSVLGNSRGESPVRIWSREDSRASSRAVASMLVDMAVRPSTASAVVLRDVTPESLKFELLAAAEAQSEIVLAYTAPHGETQSVRCVPVHVAHGFATVFDLESRGVRTVTLSRISKVSTGADDTPVETFSRLIEPGSSQA